MKKGLKQFAFIIFSLMVVLGTVGCKTKTKSTVTTKTNPTSQSTTKSTSSSDKTNSSSKQTTKKTYIALDLKSGFDQTEFFMDELDKFSLANVGFEAQYSDGSKKDIDPDDLTCEAPSQMVIGENDFTVKYTEEGVEHTFVLTITLKVKTAADVEYTTMVFERGEGETTEVTVPALPEGAKLYDMFGSEIVLEENKVTLPVGETLVKMVDGEDTEYFLVKVGTLIDSLDKFNAINEHLDGYYILTKDIIIEGKPQMIGSITIKASEADEEVKLPDFTYATNKPFTGTFDGNGYSLVGFTHVISSEEHWYDTTTYAYGVFQYVGETGVVKNLTIKHAHFEGGQNTAIVAGVNKGLIENIVIAESNYLYSNYERAAAISVYNYGTVRNVVSLLTKFHARDNKVLDLKLASINGEETEVQNGFIDKLDHTQALGSEFDFYEGYGTVLKNDKFVALLDAPKATLPFGETFEVKVVNAQNVTPVFMVQVNGADDLDIDVVKDATTGKYNLVFAEGVIQPRDEITIFVASSDSLEVVDVIFVKVLAPAIVSIEPKEAITVIEGMDLDISQIKLVVTYSDGTKVEIDVVEQVGYDKTKEVGTQTVKLIYGTGETQFIEAEVTMVAKEATGIEVKKTTEAKTVYEKGEELKLEGFTVVVKYNNNTESTPTALTAAMLDVTTFDMNTIAEYDVKVSYEGFEDTFKISVEAASLTELKVVGELTNKTFKYGHEIVEADMSGVTIKAVYSDDSEPELSFAQYAVTFDTNNLDSTVMTISYGGKSTTITGLTVEDFDKSIVVTIKELQAGQRYFVTDDIKSFFGSVKIVTASGVQKTVESSDYDKVIPINQIEAGKNYLNFALTDGESHILLSTDEALEIDLWYLVTDESDFAYINQHLDGYYVLANDIFFDDVDQDAMIGSIAVKELESNPDVKLPDFEDDNNEAFTGIFDGNGYALVGFKHVKEDDVAWYALGAYAYGIFQYVGEEGIIKNVTIKHAYIQGGQNASILVGVNKGLIENVVIADTCYLYAHYGRGAAITTYNYGTVKNVVCHLTTYAYNGGPVDMKLASVNNEVSTVENGFIGKADYTASLNDIFMFVEDYGTVLKNDKFVAIANTPNAELVLGNDFEIKVVNAEGVVPVFQVLINDVLSTDITVEKDTTTGKYSLVYNSTDLAANDVLMIQIASSASQEVIDALFITVKPPVVVSVDLKYEIEVIEGLDIDVTDAIIVFTYSDGYQHEIHPIKQEGYDKTKEPGKQTVKLFYGSGDNDFVEFEVTMVAKEAIDIEVRKSETAKSNYEIGEALDLTGYTVVILYNNNTESEAVAVTTDMLDTTTYNMSAVADYDVKVTYQGFENTFKISVKAASLSSIKVVGELDNKTFKYGHEIVEADMAGVTIKAVYSDNTETTIPFSDYSVVFDTTSLSSDTMTISYEGKTVPISGLTIEDYDANLKVNFKDGYENVEFRYEMKSNIDYFSEYFDSVKIVTASGVERDYTGEYGYIKPIDIEAGKCNIRFKLVDIDGNTVLETKESFAVTVWYQVSNVTHWAYIQSHLNGYYELADTIDFDNDPEKSLMIGLSPMVAVQEYGETDYYFDGEGNGNESGRVGAPFTGKFNGCGYTLKNFSFVPTENPGVARYGVALFGYIGKDAVVENFVLEKADIQGWQRFSILCAMLEGTLRNITVNNTYIHSTGGSWASMTVVSFKRGAGVMDRIYVINSRATYGENVDKDIELCKYAYGLDAISYCYIGDDFVYNIYSVLQPQNIEVVQNNDIDLSSISLSLQTFMDRNVIGSPTSVEEFDKTTLGEQIVRFVYSTTINYLSYEMVGGTLTLKKTPTEVACPIDATVTVVAGLKTMTALLKSGKTGVVIPYDNGWSLNSISDWSSIVDIEVDGSALTDFTGVTAVASALSGSSVKVTFSKEGCKSTEVNMVIDLEVKNHASFMAINSHGSDRFVLTQDVVLDAITNPQYISSNFSGVFDGNFHKLTISIDSTQTNAGLFKGTSSAHFTGTLKNLIVEGSVKSTTYVGGLMVNNEGTIERCVVLLKVQGNTSDGKVGGLVYSNKGTISDCIFAGTVAGAQVGGLVYSTGSQGTTENCVLVSEQAALVHFDQPSGTETGLTKISHLIVLSSRYGLSDELYDYLKTITYIPTYVCPYYKDGDHTVVGTWLAVNQVISPSEIYMSVTDNNYDPVNQDRIEIISVTCDTSVAKEDVPITIVYTVDGIEFTFTDTVGVTDEY